MANAIHRNSRRKGELVVVNCGALSENLAEAELFGHTRGAFSGAEKGRLGLVRKAEQGTLFLDEIGELPPAGQAALLRFLEQGEIRSVGDDITRKVDVRVISATHRDLDAMAETGAFRLDLLHRLAALRIHLPPLALRKEDIPPLALRFALTQGCSLSPLAIEALLLADLPGNVRQLKSIVMAGCLRAQADRGSTITPEHLPSLSRNVPGPPSSEEEAPPRGEARLAALDRDTLEAELRRQRGNIARVADALGYSRSGLYVALRRLRIEPRDFRDDPATPDRGSRRMKSKCILPLGLRSWMRATGVSSRRATGSVARRS